MGDVAMASQALHHLLVNNPDARFTVLSKGHFQPIFGNNERLAFKAVDTKGEHKGLLGIRKLFDELKRTQFDGVLDWHNVLRSRVLCSFFKLKGVSIVRFEKNRSERKKLIQNKGGKQLSHSIDKYLKVAQQAGLSVAGNVHQPELNLISSDRVERQIASGSGFKIIGIAPFAAHSSKEWGLENIIDLIKKLPDSYRVWLFGGGKAEKEQLDTIEKNHSNAINLAGTYSIGEELLLIKHCDQFIAMDSGNMHLANMMGVRTHSIWISTHPSMGFYAYNNRENCITSSDYPISVFGKVSDNLISQIEQRKSMVKSEEVFGRMTTNHQ